MKILQLEQGSQPWLSYRQKHIMATDAAIVLGLNNFKDMHQLWQEKMGFIEPEPANEAMKRGQTPPFIKLSKHKIIFPRANLCEWLREKSDNSFVMENASHDK